MKTLRYYIELAEADELARRYFVMNAFDGALTVLGVIMGAFVSGAAEPKVIITAGVGASFAMGLSGAIGAYEAERAERIRVLKELESHMFRSLQDTLIARASRAAAYWVALVDGMSPAVAALIPLFPLILAQLNFVPTDLAFPASILLNLATLFALGIFLGRIAKENVWIHGLLTLGAGALTAILLFLFFKA
ncbi:MAG: VIT1/CCC1 transporter family protein [Candidatus Bathyarchaeia archaeon]